MTLDDVLKSVQASGAFFRVDGNDIFVEGPKSALTEDVLAVLRDQKPALIAKLTQPAFLTVRFDIPEHVAQARRHAYLGDELSRGDYQTAIRVMDRAYFAGFTFWREPTELAVRSPAGADASKLMEDIAGAAAVIATLLPDYPPACAGCGEPIDTEATDWRPCSAFGDLVHTAPGCVERWAWRDAGEVMPDELPPAA